MNINDFFIIFENSINQCQYFSDRFELRACTLRTIYRIGYYKKNNLMILNYNIDIDRNTIISKDSLGIVKGGFNE